MEVVNPIVSGPRLVDLREFVAHHQDLSSSENQCSQILQQISEFEESLDEEHEVAVKLASFGQTVTISITNIGYIKPDILLFNGYVGEDYATLMQHKTQLNFLLLAVKRKDPEKPKRKIGFTSEEAR